MSSDKLFQLTLKILNRIKSAFAISFVSNDLTIRSHFASIVQEWDERLANPKYNDFFINARQESEKVNCYMYEAQNILEHILELNEIENSKPEEPALIPQSLIEAPIEDKLSNNIFIVHGRDNTAVQELKTMIYDFGLKPIILHEQASGSLTIAEKIEKYANDIGYVFVILTPDDVGYLKEEYAPISHDLGFLSSLKDLGFIRKQLDEKKEYRARQNVVLEFGFFMGLLGRYKLSCLYKGNVQLPSDMSGIVYLKFKESVNEQRLMIMRELKRAGFEIKI